MSKNGGNPQAKLNIYLCGFMGSGKSTVGRLLARRLGWRFADSDAVVEQRAGRSISEIFAQDGEERFRELETATLRTLAAGLHQVVSLGGGAVIRDENQSLIRDSGKLVYLRATPETLAQRLRNGRAQRPLLRDCPESELPARISAMLAKREVLYLGADQVISTDGLAPEHLAREIARILGLAKAGRGD